MELLKIAIHEEGSVAKLADALGVVPSAIGNWKARGIPKPWQHFLSLKYKRAIAKRSAEKSKV